MKERLVQVAAADRRYTKGEVYFALPYMDSNTKNYVTGQEKTNKRTDGLTARQIEGLDPLTEEQRMKFNPPIVMDETFRGIPISRHTKFNLSVDDEGNYINPTDKVFYDFFISGQGDVIAKDKQTVKYDQHLFYFVDETKDAEERNKTRRMVLEAQTKAFSNLKPESYYELLLYVNYNSNTQYKSVDVDGAVVEDYVYEVCEKYPKTVLNLFTKEGAEELFILKLLHYGIIMIRSGAFHDKNEKYLGNSPREVLSYLNKKGNHIIAAAWKKSLISKDARYAEFVKAQDKKDNK